MGSLSDHQSRLTHLCADVNRKMVKLPKVSLPPMVEDVFFCACHIWDLYLASYEIHPPDNEKREKIASVLAHTNTPLARAWVNYRRIRDLFDSAQVVPAAIVDSNVKWLQTELKTLAGNIAGAGIPVT